MKRLIEIDALRGFAVLCMIAFHVLMDGLLLDYWQFDPYQGWSLVLVRMGQFLFLGLVGVSIFLSQRRFKGQFLRGAKIFACGMLVTGATYLMFPDHYVRFGVLHLIGLSVPLLVLLKGREGCGLFLAALIFGASYGFPEVGTWWTIPLGLPPVHFSSLDYFPVFPWMAVPLVGLWVASKVYAGGRETVFKGFAKVPGLVWLGRHSLAVYLLHQPVLYFSLWALSNWTQ